MKKLKLLNSDFTEILSRDELKKIVGGDDYGGGDGTYPKIDACKGKQEFDECEWYWKGERQRGECRKYLAQALHCSDLN